MKIKREKVEEAVSLALLAVAAVLAMAVGIGLWVLAMYAS